MNKLTNFFYSLAIMIHTSYKKLESYKSILIKPEHHVINLAILKNRNILAFIKKITDYYGCDSYIYEYENNYSSPQKIELNLESFSSGYGIWSSFEFDNEDLIICYSSLIEVRKKENNKYILIKKIFYSGRVFDMKVKKLENNRFIVGKKFTSNIQLWGKNDNNNIYECIFEERLPSNINYSLFSNNIFNIEIKDKIFFYKHDFNNKNKKILIKKYQSKEIYTEILATRRNEKETINIYNFKCEIVCKLTINIRGIPVCTYKNFFYYLDNYTKELYAININNFKIKKYYIDLNISNFELFSLKFISNERVLFGHNNIIEYKLNANNNIFLKNKTCSENDSKCSGHLIRGKNEDIIYYGDRILFFSKEDLLKD